MLKAERRPLTSEEFAYLKDFYTLKIIGPPRGPMRKVAGCLVSLSLYLLLAFLLSLGVSGILSSSIFALPTATQDMYTGFAAMAIFGVLLLFFLVSRFSTAKERKLEAQLNAQLEVLDQPMEVWNVTANHAYLVVPTLPSGAAKIDAGEDTPDYKGILLQAEPDKWIWMPWLDAMLLDAPILTSTTEFEWERPEDSQKIFPSTAFTIFWEIVEEHDKDVLDIACTGIPLSPAILTAPAKALEKLSETICIVSDADLKAVLEAATANSDNKVREADPDGSSEA